MGKGGMQQAPLTRNGMTTTRTEETKTQREMERRMIGTTKQKQMTRLPRNRPSHVWKITTYICAPTILCSKLPGMSGVLCEQARCLLDCLLELPFAPCLPS